MTQNPKQFAREITYAIQLRYSRPVQNKIQIKLNAAGVAFGKCQTGIRDEDYNLSAANKLLCLIDCWNQKETKRTAAFPISKILYLKKPIK